MNIKVFVIAVFVLVISGLSSTAQTQPYQAVIKYYSISDNTSIISSNIILSFLKDTSNTIYTIDFSTSKEKIVSKSDHLKILYGVPSSMSLIPWKSESYSHPRYYNQHFYFNNEVYQKASYDVDFDKSDSSLANVFLYEKSRLSFYVKDSKISITYLIDPNSNKELPYYIHFSKPLNTRTRIGGGDYNFTIKWNDFIHFLSTNYPTTVTYYDPVYKVLNEQYSRWGLDAVNDIISKPCKISYRKNTIDSIRSYKEQLAPNKLYVENYTFFKSISYDSLHNVLSKEYKIKSFSLPLTKVWEQHQTIFLPDSIKTISLNNDIGYKPISNSNARHQNKKYTTHFIESINVVCKNNNRLTMAQVPFITLLLEYVDRGKITLYHYEHDPYYSPKLSIANTIDIDEIYDLYERELIYDACFEKDSFYPLNKDFRVKALKDTCFGSDPIDLLYYVKDYLESDTIGIYNKYSYSFDVKKYFEKDTSYRFNWEQHITQISLYKKIDLKNINHAQKPVLECISFDLCYYNIKGIDIHMGHVKWEDLKKIMLADKRAWYINNGKRRNYIHDIQSKDLLKFFRYMYNELE
ncbi:hypothetical protein [Cytophaga aurantiaca]|uniref:hypothetical protein n=1 Tax=Cytophaga aurantiaca TaxID=29530 RepID=UPI000377AFD0|nr:hypothetical protein [Cytophaga aurantiaca]